LEFYWLEQERVIVVQHNRKKYIIKINNDGGMKKGDVAAVGLEPATETSGRVLEELKYQRGSVLFKSVEMYADHGYHRTD
jgi:hypothetical protein